MIYIILSIAVACVWLGFQMGYFVLDRNVFGFQISPVLKRGKIENLRQYRIVHNYLEMQFEKSPGHFSNDEIVKKLNSMMSEFHSRSA